MPRYAIYFAPVPEDALWSFGSRVLGYDAATGRALAQPAIAGMSTERLAQVTSEPRKYGFHATLKAPFRLAPQWSVGQLEDAVRDFAERAVAPRIEGLKLSAIGRFLALTPVGDTSLLANYAQSVVEAFETFRAELTEEDRRRRLAAGLTDRQQAYLDRFGYPYVADEFRFHMTLTGALDSRDRETIALELSDLYRRSVAAGPVPIDRIALFEQPAPDHAFRIRAAFRHRGI
jgi:putative phosphonate metabolism protein